ncbi:DUF7344 domain-containing protein [Haloarcula marina]|uniref:DUF7344 domain-containing protein n=1 Tax=Haloarcula marina TaxID=2961574 RepID=UPI0020B84994|nr:hypothetical protein [Halomicroarcula marina]
MATRSTDTRPDELPESVVADLLATESRRAALSVLYDRGSPMVVEDLATAIVARERRVPESAVPAADRDAMREELYTEHIPKLTATGVVEYDSMVGTVELARRDVAERGRS